MYSLCIELQSPERRSAGFRGGPGERLRSPTNRGPPTKSLYFWLTIDVSLVILIEDFEINEKLCKPVQCTNSSQNAPVLAIYTPGVKKFSWEGSPSPLFTQCFSPLPRPLTRWALGGTAAAVPPPSGLATLPSVGAVP